MTENKSLPAEEALVLQAVRGNGSAFTELYDMHVERVFRHVTFRVNSVADAEDITQEVFLRAWRSIGKYKLTEKPFLAWLYTIAHNLIVDYYRKNGKGEHVQLDEAIGSASLSHDDEVDAILDRTVLQKMLTRLSDEQQLVLTLRFVDGLEHNDVAAAVGKSQAAVRVIQFRALQRLRQMIGEVGQTW
ncbi:MAG: sigma-70 family RNA polymerase sigma factor [Chloroflexi bacterium]|nr:sigma-70 family RNA polymerase sigma factor [Chloroflexota bacterium]